MRRIKGFIDLDRMISKGEIKQVNIDEDTKTVNDLDVFSYKNDVYFYKCTIGEPYNELIAEEILKDFQLPSATYDLAIYQGTNGVITKSFRKKGKKYISGDEIINNYLAYLYKDSSWKENNGDYNNLEFIWQALDYRYKENPNKKEIVSNIMDKLVDLFIFDIITGNYDRYGCNYEIEEENNEARLAPIFDNEKITKYTTVSFFVDDIEGKEKRNKDLYNQLDNFIRISSSDYINRIREKIEIISEENLGNIFERVENKTGYPINSELKEAYYTSFLYQKEELIDILDSYERGKTKQ